MTDATRLSETHQHAWVSYRTMRLRLDTRVAHDLEQEAGLSMPDYDVLAAIASIEDPCVRVNTLAGRMSWSKSRLSRQLGRMRSRGLIDREPCELDGRGDDVILTPTGRQALDDATPVHRASVRAHFADALSADQVAALADISATVIAHLDDDR